MCKGLGIAMCGDPKFALEGGLKVSLSNTLNKKGGHSLEITVRAVRLHGGHGVCHTLFLEVMASSLGSTYGCRCKEP